MERKSLYSGFLFPVESSVTVVERDFCELEVSYGASASMEARASSDETPVMPTRSPTTCVRCCNPDFFFFLSFVIVGGSMGAKS